MVPLATLRFCIVFRFSLAVVCLAGVEGLQAQGAPPLLTEDPGTPGNGNWEINIAHAHERRAGDVVTASPVVDFNYGWGERAQLKVECAYLDQDLEGGPRLRGFGRILTGLKLRFCEQEHAGVAIATFPQFEFRLPGSASTRRGLVPDENSLVLPLEFQRAFDFATVSFEIGHVSESKSGAGWFHGISVLRQISPRLTLALELRGETDRRFARNCALANACGHWQLTERTGLLFAIGRELHNRHESCATVSYVGVQFTPTFRLLGSSARQARLP